MYEVGKRLESGYAMNTNFTSNALSQLDDSTTDVLTALLRNGARQLIAQAVEAELAVLLEEHSSRRLSDGAKLWLETVICLNVAFRLASVMSPLRCLKCAIEAAKRLSLTAVFCRLT